MSAQKRKIKVALMWFSYIGEGSSFNELARQLDPEEFELIFILLKKRQGDPEVVDQNGHKVYYLSENHRIHGLEFGILGRLVRILKSENVDVLHAHRHKPGFYAALARLFVKIPVLLVHVHGIRRTKNRRRRLQNFLLFRLFDKVVGCSAAVRDDVRKTNPGVCTDKIIALENSVNYSRYANVSLSRIDARRQKLGGLSQDSFVFGMVARFGPHKGHSVLLEAFKKVKARIASAELLLIGDGRHKSDIEKQAAGTGFGDSIHFPGRRNDVPELLRALDVFVLPSTGSEGMPLSILEAMSAGVPCLSTNISGIPEIINSDRTGRIVEPGDADALAGEMINYWQMPDSQRLDIVEKARNRVRTCFSHEVILPRLAGLYKDELAAKSPDS